MIEKLWKKCVNYETVSYVICGVLTTLVDWVVYAAMCESGIDYKIAQAVSWIAAVAFAYLVNKVIVFRNFNFWPSYLWKEFSAFVACRGVSGILTWLMMVGMVDWMKWNKYLAKLITSAVNLIMNYVFSKLWIFKDSKEKGIGNGA
ncbi:MAG: GtrA family protein [Lachnospiraceae bacterium]|jgi:putative flippase GtrA|nr:GtrA family protein [Lachnospiraceae bacterium]